MGKPQVTVNRLNGNLTPLSVQNDGETLLVINAKQAVEQAWEAIIPGVYSSYEEYKQKTKLYPDSVTGEPIDIHVRHYFLNGTGQKLHVLLVAKTATLATMSTVDNADYDLINDYITAQNGKIKILAVAHSSGMPVESGGSVYLMTEPVVVAFNTLANLHADAGRPVHVLLPLYVVFNATGFTDYRAWNAPRVSLHSLRHFDENVKLAKELLGNAYTGTQHGSMLHTGFVAGVIAGLPVQRNIGRVLNGSIESTLPGNIYDLQTPAGNESEMTDKGIILAMRHAGKDGHFFNDDPSCVAATDDYKSISRNRIMNKAETLARAVYTNRLNDEIGIDPVTGKISPAAAKALEVEVLSAIETQMIEQGNCVAAEVFVDPNQNVQLTETVNVVISILPYAHAKKINVTVQFTQSIA